MTSATLRLILLVSCAHGLVHVYELAFPSVEELIQEDYQVSKQAMGLMGNCWRLPYGLGALLAGWLVDRYGAKWLLFGYLLGCSATALLTFVFRVTLGSSPLSLQLLFTTMFLMGAAASIYHPAGLALISHETQPQDRPRALGLHGIFGSLGIGLAPFLAGLVLLAAPWQGYFLFLTLPGAVLALVIALTLTEHHRQAAENDRRAATEPDDDRGQPRSYAVLILSGLLGGFVYAALVNFWPRYLGGLSIRPEMLPDRSFRNYVTGCVLLVGVAGQYTAGRFGRPGRLELQLSLVLLTVAPLLVGMAFAQGNWRILAALSVSYVLFMQQPLYNSLIAEFVPRRRRSLGYGLSNAMAFGGGSFGALYAGSFLDDRYIYGSLAVVAAASGLTALALVPMRDAA